MRLMVVGLGKLGLPMAAVLSAADYDVIGVDLDAELCARINAGECPYPEPGLAEILHHHPIHATDDAEQWAEVCDAAFVVVPTPSLPDGRFDSGAVCKAVAAVARGFVSRALPRTPPEQPTVPLIVVCSTVMPGECEGPITEAIEAEGLTVGETVLLAMSPEFVALGDVVEGMRHPAQVLVGGSDAATSALCGIYLQMYRAAGHLPPVRAMPLREAEVAKIAINSALVTKIAFANELGFTCQRAGVDASVVADAVGGDPRIGRAYLTPGGPAAGPCFPRDSRAYRAITGEHAHPDLVSLAEAAENVSYALTEWAYATLVALAAETGLPVGIAGLSYRPGAPVVEESLGWGLAARLHAEGQQDAVTYRLLITHDPQPDCPSPGFGSWLDFDVRPWHYPATTQPLWIICTPHPEYVGWPVRPGETVIDVWGICSDEGGRIVRQWESV